MFSIFYKFKHCCLLFLSHVVCFSLWTVCEPNVSFYCGCFAWRARWRRGKTHNLYIWVFGSLVAAANGSIILQFGMWYTLDTAAILTCVVYVEYNIERVGCISVCIVFVVYIGGHHILNDDKSDRTTFPSSIAYVPFRFSVPPLGNLMYFIVDISLVCLQIPFKLMFLPYI